MKTIEMEASAISQDYAEDCDEATKRLTDLMQEYLAMKKVERESVVANLSPDVRKRIYALKKLQMDTIKLEAEFHASVYDLEQKFQGKHDDVFKKRSEIVNGNHQPSDEECKMPGIEMKFDQPAEGQEASTGIPQFWLAVLKNVNELRSTIQEYDEDVLKHLIDVRAFSKPSPDLSFQLEFHFEPNEYFQNSVLTKTYLMKCCPDDDDPFSFEGPEIYKAIGCEIMWNAGKNVSEKSVKRKNSSLRFFKADSFFNFFNPPELKAEESEESDKVEAYLENDFEIGHYLKERVIPRAVLFYTGEIDEDLSDEDSLDFGPEGYEGDYENTIEGGDN